MDQKPNAYDARIRCSNTDAYHDILQVNDLKITVTPRTVKAKGFMEYQEKGQAK